MSEDRNTYLLKRYGITVAEYYAILNDQEGECGVCHRSQKGKRSFDVDHDHVTGQIRGLLCPTCNRKVIGRFRDPDLFDEAARYIRFPPAVRALGERTVPKRRKNGKRSRKRAVPAVRRRR